jgi:NADH:ubiquinone oxidoreductase subunit H
LVEVQNHALTWFVLLQPIGFVLFAIGGFAETNRAPSIWRKPSKSW